MLPSIITDHKSGNAASVSEYGQLIVAPLQYSKSVAQDLDPINTAFSFIEPRMGQKIVITDIIASADKNVSVTSPADIVIYTADGPEQLTPTEVIVNPQLIRADNLPLIGLNMLVDQGLWVNAKTDDNIVKVTIMYYRVPVKATD